MIALNSLGEGSNVGVDFFQIASTIGIATDNKQKYCFREQGNDFSEYFQKPVPYKDLDNHEIIKEENRSYKKIENLDPDKNYVLNGFFQSEKYFRHCEDLIREQFFFREEIVARLEKKYPILKDEEFTAIHFELAECSTELAEYKKTGKERSLYILGSDGNLEIVDEECNYYIASAMEEIGLNTNFLIGSDNMLHCKRFVNNGYTIYSEEKNVILDMVLMTMCKNVIISNTAASWWTAWLNPNKDKKVIAPKHWYRPNAAEKLYGKSNYLEDLIPQNWKII